MQRATWPLSALAKAVDRIDVAEEPKLLPMGSRIPEIQTLVAAFNRLQGRLALLVKARMALLGGISHDVRTFATRLRLRVDKIADASERQHAVGDIEDMVRLLDDALLTSRAGAGELMQELIDATEIVHGEVRDRQAEGNSIDLRVAPAAATALILGDRLALRRIVSNLTDNALKYGHAAHLGLDIEGQTLVLVVDDEGAGIPPDQRELLLEPFARMDASRSRGTGGVGLGLAIVRSLVKGHSGSLVVGNAPTGGARFLVRLPLYRNQSVSSS